MGDQDSCSGNLLAPNCNAEAPQDPNDDSNTKKGVCECAPGEGACPDGTLCVDKKCKCGDIPACKDAKAPTCDFANSQCMCGTGPGCADMINADAEQLVMPVIKHLTNLFAKREHVLQKNEMGMNMTKVTVYFEGRNNMSFSESIHFILIHRCCIC